MLVSTFGIGSASAANRFSKDPRPHVSFTLYTVPPPGGANITGGPDGALWFSEYGAIVRVDRGGRMRHYVIPPHPGTPGWITLGSDGALWFTDYVGGNNPAVIGRLAID
jgi:streptogramin lyase